MDSTKCKNINVKSTCKIAIASLVNDNWCMIVITMKTSGVAQRMADAQGTRALVVENYTNY